MRLLTLTGPGGTGKTRLALEVAADLLRSRVPRRRLLRRPGRASATPIWSARTIAATLGVAEARRQRPLPVDLRALPARAACCCVLDNFEQVLRGRAAASPSCWRAAPAAEGAGHQPRARCDVRGEHEFPVPPLALPDPHELPPLDALAQYPAVRCSSSAPQAVQPDFALTADERRRRGRDLRAGWTACRWRSSWRRRAVKLLPPAGAAGPAGATACRC